MLQLGVGYSKRTSAIRYIGAPHPYLEHYVFELQSFRGPLPEPESSFDIMSPASGWIQIEVNFEAIHFNIVNYFKGTLYLAIHELIASIQTPCPYLKQRFSSKLFYTFP